MAFDFQNILATHVPETTRVTPAQKGKYDFAVTYPDPVSLPHAEILECLKEALSESGSELAVYPHPQGNTPLRQYVAEKIGRDRGIKVTENDIILGNGSGQPIDMICAVLLNPGDVVITDSFVYGGTLNTLRRHFTDIRGVASDESGMDPEALDREIEKAIQAGHKPKFVYLIPTFQNPQGWTIPESRRKELLTVTQKYGVPILEDDCYADNRYDGDLPTSILSLDDTSSVMYVGSFSKTIAPGMSLGYMTAPQLILDRAMGVKSGRVSEFTAMAVEKYARKYLDAHIEEINNIQRTKRDAMLSALGENFGTGAKWSDPAGGLYIWVKLKEGSDMVALNKRSVEEIDVGFHPGTNYSPDGALGKDHIRLCFGYNQPDEITEGISRLANFLSKEGALDF
jgi:2-aminoadipate transaminase